MKKMGLTGIVAVVTSVVGKFTILGRRNPTQFMTRQQLSTLIEEGWEIASHSVTHPFRFDRLSREQTQWELSESKKWIIENLCITPTKFAVPRHLIRKDQIELAMKYYSHIRHPKKGIIFHIVKERMSFEARLREVI